MAGTLSLVELAANDDVEGMKALLEGGKASLRTTEPWYCRRNCSTKLSLLERTPLMVACLFGSTRVLAFILEHVSATNSLRGNAGGTPAPDAQSGAKHDPIDINFRSPSDGSTALHCAVIGGSSKASEIVAALLRHGASKDLGDFNGKVPLEAIAVSPKLPHVKTALERLLKCGSDAALAPFVTLPGSPELTPPDAPSSPSSISPDRDSPFTAPSSPSNSDNSGNKEFAVGDPKYPQDASLPDIKNSQYASDDFRMYSFKIRPCSRAYSHDWTECPFVHPGENARRRDPRRFNYSCVPCPDFRKGACRRGDACEYAHGVFECWLHPTQYRTRLCKEGTSCERRVCFFAHTPEELRPLQVPSGAGAGIMSPRGPGVGDMLSVTFSPDIPPPSPSTVILTGRPSSASGSATPPVSPPNESNMWLNSVREGARSPHTPGDGSPARGPIMSPPRRSSGDLGKAAAAGLNLSRLRAALAARDRGIPEEKEAVEAAVLQQQLTANMQAALLADLYSKLSMSNAAAAAAVQQNPVAIAAALQQQIQVQQQFQAQQQLLQLHAQQNKLAAALAANAAAGGNNEALSALLNGSGGSGNYRGAVGACTAPAGTRLPTQLPATGPSNLSLCSDETYGAARARGYESPVRRPSALPSRTFSSPLSMASPRVAPDLYTSTGHAIAQVPPFKLDGASGPGTGADNKGAFGGPEKLAGVLNVAAASFNAQTFGAQARAETVPPQGSLSASGGGVSGASTDSLVLPDDLNTWGPPLGAPDWSSSSAASLATAGTGSSLGEGEAPAMLASAAPFRSSSLAERNLDGMWK